MATRQEKTAKKESIGFLRASEKAHIAVGDIPLTFLSDLGYMPKKMKSAKKWNRKFVTGMYERLEGMVDAPGDLMDVVSAKLKQAKAEGKRASKSAAKQVAVKPKPKAAAKPKAKAAAKPKAKAAAKPKAKAAETTPSTKAIGIAPKPTSDIQLN